MSSNRRDFLKKVTTGAAGVAVGGSAMGMSAKSYGRIIGANDRLNVCIMGLGRRFGAYIPPISNKDNNVRLLYLCDVMKSQREKAAARFSEKIDYSKAGKRYTQSYRRSGCGCHLQCHSRSLARAWYNHGT